MAFDATFWVAISFIIFFLALVYFKIPQKVNELLDKMINDIKNEISESEKLRSESKALLDNAQNKLDSAKNESKKILDQAKKDSEKLIIEMNDKFHKSAEIKKSLTENKIKQRPGPRTKFRELRVFPGGLPPPRTPPQKGLRPDKKTHQKSTKKSIKKSTKN